MAYTNVDNIKALVRGLEIGTGTVITEDKLDLWIAQVGAYIDGRLASYYITPITGAKSLKIVSMIADYKVTHIVKTVLELTSENSDKRQDVQTNLDFKAEKMLKDLLPTYSGNIIMEPVLKLPDADFVSRSPEKAALTSMSQQGGTFKKGGDNW